MNRKTTNESPHATLPGRLYRKQARWWWNVQLPGEKSSRSRALKPQGARCATTDRQLAEEIAFHVWQEAVRTEARAAARAEQTLRVQRLRLHFRRKLKTLRDVIATAEARAEAETAQRLKLEVRLNSLRNELTQMAPCDCCGRNVPQSELQPIDSGQRLCRCCLDGLHQAAQRPSSQAQKTEDETRGADLPARRDNHDSDVLYAETGSR